MHSDIIKVHVCAFKELTFLVTTHKMEIRDIWFFTSLHEGALANAFHDDSHLNFFPSNYEKREKLSKLPLWLVLLSRSNFPLHLSQGKSWNRFVLYLYNNLPMLPSLHFRALFLMCSKVWLALDYAALRREKGICIIAEMLSLFQFLFIFLWLWSEQKESKSRETRMCIIYICSRWSL